MSWFMNWSLSESFTLNKNECEAAGLASQTVLLMGVNLNIQTVPKSVYDCVFDTDKQLQRMYHCTLVKESI
jgi:hypothetical protein